ncbi:MAG: hypothetical protein PWR01_600 [Clostridiales bacterium]|nr:hypothetical protein [Clostridiales bacterium]
MDYVGCKACILASALQALLCFIWTMWDVKDEADKKLESAKKVLYGLCGM